MICFFLLGITAFKPNIARAVRVSIVDFFTPLIQTVSVPVQSASLVLDNMVNVSSLQAENVRLKEENERLKKWYQTAIVLESDNKALRTLLNVHPDPQQHFISARVISDSANRFVKTLLVSVGRESGVKPFQAVVTGTGLIGRVIDVGNKAARILLLTDISSKVPVLIAGTNQHAIISGDNTDLLVLEYLDKDNPIAPGMKVITSGHAEVFPSGIAIGEIVSVENNITRVKPFNDMKNIVYVSILDSIKNQQVKNIDMAQ